MSRRRRRVPDVCGVPAQFACVSPHVALGPGGGLPFRTLCAFREPTPPAPREAVTNHARFTPEDAHHHAPARAPATAGSLASMRQFARHIAASEGGRPRPLAAPRDGGCSELVGGDMRESRRCARSSCSSPPSRRRLRRRLASDGAPRARRGGGRRVRRSPAAGHAAARPRRAAAPAAADPRAPRRAPERLRAAELHGLHRRRARLPRRLSQHAAPQRLLAPRRRAGAARAGRRHRALRAGDRRERGGVLQRRPDGQRAGLPRRAAGARDRARRRGLRGPRALRAGRAGVGPLDPRHERPGRAPIAACAPSSTRGRGAIAARRGRPRAARSRGSPTCAGTAARRAPAWSTCASPTTPTAGRRSRTPTSAWSASCAPSVSSWSARSRPKRIWTDDGRQAPQSRPPPDRLSVREQSPLCLLSGAGARSARPRGGHGPRGLRRQPFAACAGRRAARRRPGPRRRRSRAGRRGDHSALGRRADLRAGMARARPALAGAGRAGARPSHATSWSSAAPRWPRAGQRRQVLDRLKDRKRQAHQVESIRREAVALDEIALNGHVAQARVMSLATIGTRLEQLQTMVAQMTAPAAPRPGCAAELVVRRRPRLRPDFAVHRARGRRCQLPPSEPRSMRPRQATGSTRRS